MKDQIVSELRIIEQKENVKVLLAVESGSRAWGFESPDSDYDVRFIYAREPETYLRLDKARDVLEYPISDLLDISGWDISKALSLLHGSNPTLYEWFDSRIVYAQKPGFKESMASLLDLYFSPKKCIGHYLHMAKNNSKDFLKGDIVRLKKYFYVLRSLLAARWIVRRNEPAPILFLELVNSEMPSDLRPIVDDLLEKKKHASEVKNIDKIDILNDYIDSLTAEVSDAMDRIPAAAEPGWEPLNKRFLQELGLSFSN